MTNDLSYHPTRAADHRQDFLRQSDQRPHSQRQPTYRPEPPRPADPPEQTSSRSSESPAATPNIADRFADLLAPLSARRRRGLIARISVGYYEGWRPTRAEVAELVAQELRRSPR